MAKATTGMIIDATPAGSQLDLQFSWNAASGASGYHVLQSDSAGFDLAVDLLGRTAGATSFATTSAASTPGLTFFQVRGTNFEYFHRLLPSGKCYQEMIFMLQDMWIVNSTTTR